MGHRESKIMAVPAHGMPEDRLGQARPRIRILLGHDQRLGPGKFDLLEAIGRTGSISAAGRQLGMSYRRAWLLVDQVNRMFLEPVVIASAGGSNGGGALLTEFGQGLLQAYRRLETRTQQAIAEEFAPFEAALAEVQRAAPDETA